MIERRYEATAGWVLSTIFWLKTIGLGVAASVVQSLTLGMWAIIAAVAAATLTLRTCVLHRFDMQARAFELGKLAGEHLRRKGDGRGINGLPSMRQQRRRDDNSETGQG